MSLVDFFTKLSTRLQICPLIVFRKQRKPQMVPSAGSKLVKPGFGVD